jgi:VanZ family protein
MTLRRFWWALGVIVVIAAIIVCLVPDRELPRSFEYNDKLSHITGHGLMAIYFSGLVARRSWWKIFAFLLLLGTAIEFAQYYMHAGREGDWHDVVANSLGAIVGLALGWIGLARWPDIIDRILGRATQ